MYKLIDVMMSHIAPELGENENLQEELMEDSSRFTKDERPRFDSIGLSM